MKKKPFFSIVIPTYNRASFLKIAIKSILQQSFADFELIISDNCSPDETEKIVKSFKDKRIKYFRNVKNIGAERNIGKVISHASGQYIFSLGDDDFILFNTTLAEVKKILDKEKYGFIRLNLVEKKFIGNGLRKSIITVEKDMKIEKHASAQKIMDFFFQVGAGHIAGLVIKNSPKLSQKMILSPDIPWIKLIYESVEESGGYFLHNFYMIITWSQGEILHYYDVPSSNRLMFENISQYIFSLISKEERNGYALSFYKRYISLQPVIKLYSSNANLIQFDKRLLQLEPRLKRESSFWFFLICALLVPKSVWRVVRVVQHKRNDTFHTLTGRKKIASQVIKLSNS